MKMLMFVFLLVFLNLGNGFMVVEKYIENETFFDISVVHVNDFHSRFDEVSNTVAATPCQSNDSCIGGFSRLYTEIKKLQKQNPQALLLNGGDNFQGTLYYDVGKWNITQEFLGKLPWDAFVIGNHDFEDGVQGLISLIESMKAPFLAANIDALKEPNLENKFSKSTIIKMNGKKIGIIGVIYSKTNLLANTGNLTFYPESPAVNEEAERLVREKGVFTNIVLSHSGYDVDQAIAANASEKIGLIVGAHSHTFLWTGDNPPGPDNPVGPYPTIVTSKNNKTVLVVQASAYTKYLGNITVSYNSDGEVVRYSGAPIFLGHDKPTDEKINLELHSWTKVVVDEGNRVMGSTLVQLNSQNCSFQECLLGNFYTDSMVFAYTKMAGQNSWTYASVSLLSLAWGSADYKPGNLTYLELYLAQQYKNTIDVGELKGVYIKEALEQGTESYNNDGDYTKLQILQVSGLKVTYDLSRPKGDQVIDLKIRCQQCLIPSYEDLKLDQTYRVVVNSYTRKGNDQFTAISQNLKNVVVGDIDLNVTLEYLKQRSPIVEQVEGRIVFL